MLTCPEVIPLIALGIDFEWRCALVAEWRAIPMVNALYSCWCMAMLLQIICNCDLLDMLYIHCDFVLMFEMNNSQPFSFGGWCCLFGRMVVHYRHYFATDQTYFSLVGLVQVYIACVRPTNGFRADNLCWADIFLVLPWPPCLCWAEIARVLWVWFAHRIIQLP